MSEISITYTVLLEIGATFLGVIFALAADHWNQNRIDTNRVKEIIPYIYMEISENLKHIQRNEGPFLTEYWLGHEADFVKWNEKETLLRIIRIYNLMKITPSPNSLTINDRTHYANLLIEIVSWFDTKAESDKKFENKLEKTKEEYTQMTQLLREGGPSQYKSFKPKYFQ